MATTKTDICNLALSETGNEGNQITDFDNDTGKSARQCRLHYQRTLEELIRTHTWGCCKNRIQTHFEFITIGNTDNSDGDIDFLDLLNGYPRYQTGTVTVSHDGVETWTTSDTGVPETWTVTSTEYNPPETGWSAGSATSDEATVAYPQPVFDWTEKFILPSDCLRPLVFSATDETTIYYKFNDEWTIEGRNLLTNYDQGYLLYLKEPTIAEMDSLFIRAFVVLLASKLAVPVAGDRKMKIDLINEFDRVIMPEARRVNGFEGYENPMVDSEWMEATMSSSDASSSWPPFQQSSYGTLKH